jgi:hypothetical protein
MPPDRASGLAANPLQVTFSPPAPLLPSERWGKRGGSERSLLNDANNELDRSVDILRGLVVALGSS